MLYCVMMCVLERPVSAQQLEQRTAVQLCDSSAM
jgi:hypothetical protein